jgi:hypothetical protein
VSLPIESSFTGFVLRDGRRGGFCWEEKPRCVNAFAGEPHRLATKRPVITDTIAHCEHRPALGQGECGARLYVALLSFGGSAKVQGRGERVWLVVEVTPTTCSACDRAHDLPREDVARRLRAPRRRGRPLLGGVDELSAEPRALVAAARHARAARGTGRCICEGGDVTHPEHTKPRREHRRASEPGVPALDAAADDERRPAAEDETRPGHARRDDRR